MRIGILFLVVIALTKNVAAEPKPNPYPPGKPTVRASAPPAPKVEIKKAILEASPRRRDNPYVAARHGAKNSHEPSTTGPTAAP